MSENNFGLSDNFSTIVSRFEPISLSEMDGVKLMHRVDTKFIIHLQQLPALLEMSTKHYRIVQIDNQRISPYSSVYFDTDDAEMYKMHHNGKLNRHKVRMRSYLNSGVSFFEIKIKNNKGRTSKKRMAIDANSFEKMTINSDIQTFIKNKLSFDSNTLKPQLQNFFQRITLVDKELKERVTLDIGLSYRKVGFETEKSIDDLVIIEIKQDAANKSFFRDYLSVMHVHPGSLSKYCMGMILLNPEIKSNQFKIKLRKINKITQR